MNTTGEGFNIVGGSVREVVKEMINGGIAAGAPLPEGCDKDMLIDLTAHACESALRVLADHVNRAPLGPDGGDLVMMAIVAKAMELGCGALKETLHDFAQLRVATQMAQRH